MCSVINETRLSLVIMCAEIRTSCVCFIQVVQCIHAYAITTLCIDKRQISSGHMTVHIKHYHKEFVRCHWYCNLPFTDVSRKTAGFVHTSNQQSYYAAAWNSLSHRLGFASHLKILRLYHTSHITITMYSTIEPGILSTEVILHTTSKQANESPRSAELPCFLCPSNVT